MGEPLREFDKSRKCARCGHPLGVHRLMVCQLRSFVGRRVCDCDRFEDESDG